MPNLLNAISLAVGIVLLAGLGAAAWTSTREREPRAAGILLLLAMLIPLPYLAIGLVDFAGEFPMALTLLGGTGLAVLVLLSPARAPRSPQSDTPTTQIDERDIMFSRMLLRPGTDRFRNYYDANPDKKVLDDGFRANPGLLSDGAAAHHPLGFPAAYASFATIGHLRPFVDGSPATPRLDVDAASATRFVKRWTLKLGAVSVGITRLEPYHLYSHVGRGPEYGQPVRLDHPFAIALTVEMSKESLDHAPLAPTLMESAQQYVASGVIAVQLADCIRRLGYAARAHIDGNYRVVCPLVARDAGLGEIGRMGLLMTPELGPRVRIAVVTTELPLIPDERERDFSMLDFCARCSKCAEVCPSDAIPTTPRTLVDGALRWQIDSEACFTLWSAVGTDCARCMAACPYSHPDNWLHDLVRRGIRSAPVFRRMAVSADDALYGRNPAPRPLPEFMAVDDRTPSV